MWSRRQHSQASFAFTLLASTAAACSATVAAESPCLGRYSDWVAKPSSFVRADQPKHLQGLHIVCIWRENFGEPLQIEAYRNAVDDGAPLRAVLPLSAESTWQDFRRELKTSLSFRRRTNDWSHQRLKQPFGIFSELGARLSSPAEVVDSRLVFVAEGGQWFWPPMYKGFVRSLPGTEFELETLSVQPVIFRVRGFLHDNECSEIVRLGEGRMVNSPVSLMDKDKGKESKEFRTSTQARVHSKESPMLGAIDNRIATLTRVPVHHNEEVQILRYQKTQYYSAHLDNWDPSFYSGSDTSFMEHGHKNRLITVFWYLTNVSEGGETFFPRTDGLPQPSDMYACGKGLKVKPEQGSVIFWYSLHPNGNTDPNGLHAACPVSTGEKWSANYWVWNKPRWGSKMPDAGLDEPDGSEDDGAERTLEESPASGGGGVVAQFVNTHPSKTRYLFWLDPSGAEVPLGNIGPRQKTSMNSFPGHRWMLRAGPETSSHLVDSFVVSKKAVQEHVSRAEPEHEEV